MSPGNIAETYQLALALRIHIHRSKLALRLMTGMRMDALKWVLDFFWKNHLVA